MDGIIIINKPKNCTSHDIVRKAKKILNEKVGHTGTLDPIAEGVLVICVGKCTKLCDYFTSNDKEYIAEFKLGYETDTLDYTGEIIKSSNLKVNEEQINEVIKNFIGKYNQVVPIYSAVKINGKKLYEYARNNIDVSLPSRVVDIKNIEVLNIDETIKIQCKVSKGTYIRSLIRDIGDKLGTYATMTSLIRTRQGEFSLENSYSLEDIKNNNYNMITVEEIFEKYPKVFLDDKQYKKISNGVILDNIYLSEYVLFYYNNNLVSIYKEYKKDKLKPFIMI